MATSTFEIKDLPVMPQVATKILQLQEDNLEISFNELEKIILIDPALTAKILKVANSALYARKKEITNLQQALTLLGFKMIKSLVLLVSASNMFGKTQKKLRVSANMKYSKYTHAAMWSHSVLTAFISKVIALKLGVEVDRDDLFIAGLLHDIGRTVYLINDIDRYQIYLDTINSDPECDILSIEKDIFKFDHQEVGKVVLEKWNFPDEYIDIVSQHHQLHIDSPFKIKIEIVGLANIYATILEDMPVSSEVKELKTGFMKELNFTESHDEYILTEYKKELEEDEFYTMSVSIS